MLTPYLEARGIRKRFGHVEALRGADFSASLGEIVALVGDNGAGKSTLAKTLSGAIIPDAGSILIEGKPVVLDSPITARRCGIEIVYQDLALAGDLSPAANMFLGRELKRGGILGRLGFLDDKAMLERSNEIFGQFAMNIATQGRVLDLSGGQRQSVAVARAAAWASQIIILDEPTAALGVIQSRAVHDLMFRIRANGLGVILISHNMTEVLEIADRVEVMRFGVRVASLRASEATVQTLVTAMTSEGEDTNTARENAGQAQ
jgi:simple sugar transport system ATP-binding protein